MTGEAHTTVRILVCLLALCTRLGFAGQDIGSTPSVPSTPPQVEVVDTSGSALNLMLAQAADRGCCVLKTAGEARCMSSNRTYCSEKAASAAVQFTFLPGKRCHDLPECPKR